MLYYFNSTAAALGASALPTASFPPSAPPSSPLDPPQPDPPQPDPCPPHSSHPTTLPCASPSLRFLLLAQLFLLLILLLLRVLLLLQFSLLFLLLLHLVILPSSSNASVDCGHTGASTGLSCHLATSAEHCDSRHQELPLCAALLVSQSSAHATQRWQRTAGHTHSEQRRIGELTSIRSSSNSSLSSTPFPQPTVPTTASTLSCSYGLVACCQAGSYQCGLRFPPPPGSSLASPGQASFGAYPWQAALLTTADVYLGGGALISAQHVLTAAHKVYNLA